MRIAVPGSMPGKQGRPVMRLAIVNNDPSLCESLRLILAGESDMSVIGAFRSGRKALKALAGAAPDIVIVNPDLPDIPGDEFIKKLKACFTKIDVLAYTDRDDRKSVFSVLKAGATGYLLKGTRPRDLVEAIAGVYRGGAPLSPKVARMVVRELQEQYGAGTEGLSRKQAEVLREMDRGLTYREIAKGLGISPLTVRTHIRNIYEKLGVKSKADAIRKAKKEGIL